MAHCNLQLDWKLLEVLRNKRLVHDPLEFRDIMEDLEILRNKGLVYGTLQFILDWKLLEISRN